MRGDTAEATGERDGVAAFDQERDPETSCAFRGSERRGFDARRQFPDAGSAASICVKRCSRVQAGSAKTSGTFFPDELGAEEIPALGRSVASSTRLRVSKISRGGARAFRGGAGGSSAQCAALMPLADPSLRLESAREPDTSADSGLISDARAQAPIRRLNHSTELISISASRFALVKSLGARAWAEGPVDLRGRVF